MLYVVCIVLFIASVLGNAVMVMTKKINKDFTG